MTRFTLDLLQSAWPNAFRVHGSTIEIPRKVTLTAELEANGELHTTHSYDGWLTFRVVGFENGCLVAEFEPPKGESTNDG